MNKMKLDLWERIKKQQDLFKEDIRLQIKENLKIMIEKYKESDKIDPNWSSFEKR